MDFDLPLYRKGKESGKFIERALRNSVYLQQIISDRQALKAIINAMEPITVAPKTLVAEAGKLGDKMYVCAQGLLEMYAQDGTNFTIVGPGQVFGEMAFICFTKRKRSIRAKSQCKLWVLHQSIYIKILKMFYTFAEEDYITFLKTIPVLRELSTRSLLNIRKLVRVECYAPDSDIIKQGDVGNDFFIITGGTALVHATWSDGTEKLLDQLQKGDFFGEGAILGNGLRNATVTAEAPGVECILLEKQHFTQFFEDIEYIEKAAKKREEMMKKIIENGIEYHFVRIEDLEVKGIISNGSFGRIELVQYKPYSELLFALKVLKKAYVTQNDLIQNALNEKEILMSCKSPFIVRLYKTFKDAKYLYYLQQACLGGDLQHLLEQRNNFDDGMTKFITACITEALDYLHTNGIIYGNLETKNLVFDTKGYIKLVDFGCAKRISSSSGNTETSTNDQENLNPSSDYWFLGCLIFEMLVGIPPFTGWAEENGTVKSDDKDVHFPVHVTKPARSIIRKMWKQKPSRSSEEQRVTAHDVRNHRWFHNFPWIELQNESLPAPYIPKLQSPTDLSNFAKTEKDKEIPPDCYAEWDKNF